MSDGSEKNTLVSPSNLNTLVVVGFILALLALVLGFYNHTRTNQLYAGVITLQNASIERDKKLNTAVKSANTSAELGAVEARVTSLETWVATTPAAPATDAAAATTP